jgi:predicted hydrolase (HD superfamily)
VQKKMKQKAFAAQVNREDIEQGARELGVELPDHIGRVLQALQGAAGSLGL